MKFGHFSWLSFITMGLQPPANHPLNGADTFANFRKNLHSPLINSTAFNEFIFLEVLCFVVYVSVLGVKHFFVFLAITILASIIVLLLVTSSLINHVVPT